MLLELFLCLSAIWLCGANEVLIVSTTQSPNGHQSSTTDLKKQQEQNLRIEKLERQILELQTLAKNQTLANNHSTSITSKQSFPENCLEVQKRGNSYSGTFTIQPKFSPHSFSAVCEIKRGGGWTLILQRVSDAVDFDMDWSNYKNGFGNLNGDFWLGLENIHQLSGYNNNELLVELFDFDYKYSYAHYKYFGIGSESEGYPLKTLGGFSGDATDALAYHSGMKFTTKDRDQDNHTSNCAVMYTGGWWYNGCHWSHLTGKYSGTTIKYISVCWGEKFYLKEARMYIRP